MTFEILLKAVPLDIGYIMGYSIRSKTMLGTSHSWAVTMRSLLFELYKLENDLYLESINGVSMLEPPLLDFTGRTIEEADVNFCYTMPRNFKSRTKDKAKLNLAIYNYETSHLPEEWADKHKYVDFVLPSSKFSKQVFLDAGYPKEKLIVVPHGIYLEDFKNKDKYEIRTQKTFKFLNVSINHYRKNLDLLIQAYYNAFTDKDDVCLVIKTTINPPKGRRYHRFELDFIQMLKNVQKKYLDKGRRDLPNIEVIGERLSSMIPLYNACDALVSATSAEGFGLPMLEALAADKIVIAPHATGHLDFLNKKNSLLVPVRITAATSKHQYWKVTPGATTFVPEIDELSAAMIVAYKHHKRLNKKFKVNRRETVKELTWENAARQILEIIDENI